MRGISLMSIDKNKLKGEYLNSSYSEIANLLGIEAALKLHSQYRGTQIFFPVELFSREFIVKQIVEEYNGYNVKELATKYGYTEKWIRKILKDHIDNNNK